MISKSVQIDTRRGLARLLAGVAAMVLFLAPSALHSQEAGGAEHTAASAPGQEQTMGNKTGQPSFEALTLPESWTRIPLLALTQSTDYQSTLLSLNQASINLKSPLLLDQSSITVNGSYNDTQSAANSDPWGLSASLTIPVIQQLTLAASLDQDLNTSLSLSSQPFGHTASYDTTKLAWQSALAKAEQSRRTTLAGSLEAALNWMVASRALDLAIRREALSQAQYQDTKAIHDLDAGEATLDEVRDALKEWNTSRSDLGAARKTLSSARTTLQSILGSSPESLELDSGSLDQVQDLLAQCRGLTLPSSYDSGLNPEVQMALYNRDSAKASLDHTWIWEPDVTVSAGLNLTADGQSGLNAGLKLSFSLGDIQDQEQQQARKTWELSQATLSNTQTSVQNRWLAAVETLAQAQVQTLSLQTAWEQAKELLAEVQSLHQRGEKSQLELEGAVLDLDEAGLNLSQGMASELAAWFGLMSFYP